jgi:hypothetical protein
MDGKEVQYSTVGASLKAVDKDMTQQTRQKDDV